MSKEAIEKLLNSVNFGDKDLYELTSPLVKQCEILSNGDEKEFKNCLNEAFYIGLYITDHLELPQGLKKNQQNKV